MVERQNNTRNVRLGNFPQRQTVRKGICPVSRGGGWSSSDYGYIKFTSGSNSVEFPAVGWRDTSGTLNLAGTWGRYWSSVVYSSSGAYSLTFDSSDLYVGSGNKQNGRSVRCVR